MKYGDLKYWTEKAAQWIDDYYRELRDRPVRSQVKPGEIAEQIPSSPPEAAESMEEIFEDFKRIIPDGMTHWQHPRFFAYFNSNAAPASILAEHFANAFSAQCMLWQTSPAATELETVMVDWIRQAVGLPDSFQGVIQDSATSATLSAVLTMRERAIDWTGLETGLAGQPQLRVYCSDQVHSSIDQSIRIAGIGQENLVKVATDSDWAMCPQELQRAISNDRAQGFLPAGLVACVGGTSIGASDWLEPILEIANREQLYSHVDAAWAGVAMLCPELRAHWQGVEFADSIVLNPHKWMGANFDCSIQFLADPDQQIRTLTVKPHYLKTLESTHVTNYSEWVIPLGRRFRALKLWFLIRCYGLEGLRTRIRNHIEWAKEAAQQIDAIETLKVVTWPMFSLFTFCVQPVRQSNAAPPALPEGANAEQPDRDVANRQTQRLLERINADGRIYLTQTTHDGQFVIRMTMGQFDCCREDVQVAIKVIQEMALTI